MNRSECTKLVKDIEEMLAKGDWKGIGSLLNETRTRRTRKRKCIECGIFLALAGNEEKKKEMEEEIKNLLGRHKAKEFLFRAINAHITRSRTEKKGKKYLMFPVVVRFTGGKQGCLKTYSTEDKAIYLFGLLKSYLIAFRE